MSPRFIYLICDSVTKHVRYVGQSASVEARCYDHTFQKTPVGEWIRSRIEAGEPPVCIIVAKLSPTLGYGFSGEMFEQCVNGAERRLIAHFHRWGRGELLNVACKPSTRKYNFKSDATDDFPHGELIKPWQNVKPNTTQGPRLVAQACIE